MGYGARQCSKYFRYCLINLILSITYDSRVQLFATPWTAAHQAPLSMGFSRQGNWSGLPFSSPITYDNGSQNLSQPQNLEGLLKYRSLGTICRASENLCVCTCSVVSDSFATPWTVAGQVSLSMGFFRQEYWSV